MPNNTKTFLLDFTLDELKEFLSGIGAEAFRAKQIYEGVYKKFASSFDEIAGSAEKT